MLELKCYKCRIREIRYSFVFSRKSAGLLNTLEQRSLLEEPSFIGVLYKVVKVCAVSATLLLLTKPAIAITFEGWKSQFYILSSLF